MITKFLFYKDRPWRIYLVHNTVIIYIIWGPPPHEIHLPRSVAYNRIHRHKWPDPWGQIRRRKRTSLRHLMGTTCSEWASERACWLREYSAHKPPSNYRRRRCNAATAATAAVATLKDPLLCLLILQGFSGWSLCTVYPGSTVSFLPYILGRRFLGIFEQADGDGGRNRLPLHFRKIFFLRIFFAVNEQWILVRVIITRMIYYFCRYRRMVAIFFFYYYHSR